MQKYDLLDKKVDSLNKKMDRHYEQNCKEHISIATLERKFNVTLSTIQKDVKNLRTDVDTVYSLETYCCKIKMIIIK